MHLSIALKPQYGRASVEYIVLRIQMKFAHSLLRWGWPWVGDNLITYVCFFPSRLHVFAVGPQYQHQDFFIIVKSIIEIGLRFEWGL